MQRIIEIDSQMLNSIQNCHLKHEMAFVENLKPEKKAEPLEKGSLLHKVLELYDGLMGKCVDMTADTWQELSGEHIVAEFSEKLEPTKRDIIDFCLKAGEIFASKMEVDSEETDNVLFQFGQYCDFYTNDPWKTLAVEAVGTKLLFENALIKIVYTVKIDRLVEQGNIIAPMDHKSSSRRGDVSSLSNQFIGYCWAMGTNHIIIDKVGFQKTLKPAERFQRIILHVDDARINEWVNNSIDVILNYLSLTTENDSDATLYFIMLRERQIAKRRMMNFTSCDKYSGCIYKSICESNPEGRDWNKERDFIKGEPWDVGSILEAKA